MKDFFISYSKSDRDWAVWIASHLEANGLKTVLQDWDFMPGSNFILRMHQATKDTKRTIAVLSQEYLKSLMSQPEWAATLLTDPTGEQRRLVPVRVKECKPDGLLAAICYIDLVGLSQVDAETILLQGLTQERLKPSNPSPYPGHFMDKSPKYPGSGNFQSSNEKTMGEKQLASVSKIIDCPYCDRTGEENHLYRTICRVCGGDVEIKITFPPDSKPVSCGYCGGTGKENKLYGTVCRICNGIGVNIIKKSAKQCRRCNGSGKENQLYGDVCQLCKGIGYKLMPSSE